MSYSQTLKPSADGWPWRRAAAPPASIRDVASNLWRAKRHVRLAVRDLGEGQLWRRIGSDVMAVGNLLMHMRGSEHQWIACKIGRRPLVRDRDAEFATRGGPGLGELLDALDRASLETDSVLAGLAEADVAGFRSDPEGLSIPFILHYTAQHVALHLGQLIVVREFLSPGWRLEAALLEDEASFRGD